MMAGPKHMQTSKTERGTFRLGFPTSPSVGPISKFQDPGISSGS